MHNTSIDLIILIVQVVSSLVLVIITGIYTSLTRKLVVVNQKQLQLYTGLYPAISNKNEFEYKRCGSIESSNLANGIWLKFNIENVGNVPFYFTYIINMNEFVSKTNAKIILQPKQQLNLECKFDFNEIEKNEIDSLIKLKLIYWNINDYDNKYFIEREFKLEKDYLFIVGDKTGEVIN